MKIEDVRIERYRVLLSVVGEENYVVIVAGEHVADVYKVDDWREAYDANQEAIATEVLRFVSDREAHGMLNDQRVVVPFEVIERANQQ